MGQAPRSVHKPKFSNSFCGKSRERAAELAGNRLSANNAKTPEKSTTVAGSGAVTKVRVPSSEVVSLYCRSKFVSALKPAPYELSVAQTLSVMVPVGMSPNKFELS